MKKKEGIWTIILMISSTSKKLFLLFLVIFSRDVLGKEEVRLSKCIDGDTFEIIENNKKKKVRMLAVDTPETKHPKKKEEPIGKLASDYTCLRLKINRIYLEYDENSDKQDKYNRILAWVFVGESLLQEELVEKGFAKVAYLYGDYKYTERLLSKEKDAKKEELGIWNKNSGLISFLINIISDIIKLIIASIINWFQSILNYFF